MAKSKKARPKSGKKRKTGSTGNTRQKSSQQRAVLFRPDRLKYVRKVDRPKGCVFCTAKEMGTTFESLVLYIGEHAMVVMNKFPYNPGHLLVLPTRHCGDFLELTKEELNGIQALKQMTVQILSESNAPAGFNLGLNLGSASGAGIPEHLHYHIVPRWNGDTNFFPLLAETKVVVETLEQTFHRLLPLFQQLGGREQQGKHDF